MLDKILAQVEHVILRLLEHVGVLRAIQERLDHMDGSLETLTAEVAAAKAATVAATDAQAKATAQLAELVASNKALADKLAAAAPGITPEQAAALAAELHTNTDTLSASTATLSTQEAAVDTATAPPAPAPTEPPAAPAQ